jgi:hypothetical protein
MHHIRLSTDASGGSVLYSASGSVLYSAPGSVLYSASLNATYNITVIPGGYPERVNIRRSSMICASDIQPDWWRQELSCKSYEKRSVHIHGRRVKLSPQVGILPAVVSTTRITAVGARSG